MIYTLLRLAWEKKVLVIGLIKGMSASELIKSVVPVLQTSSVVNPLSSRKPWRTFEFDACFRTVAPLYAKEDNEESRGKIENKVKVAGDFKNVISSERIFLKSYVQLWCSERDPTVRSHVFSYDMPCYPGFMT